MLEVLWRIADHTPFSFERLVRLPQIGADLTIAWLIQWHLGWRGADPATRLIAAALVVLAPVDVFLSSAHGQIDPVQWLPIVLAIIAWDRLAGDRRLLVTGLLIGAGIAIKTPAMFAIPAFLALAEDWRARGVLAVGVAAIPALLVAPFALADPQGIAGLRHYTSISGQGGLTLFIQPDLGLARFAGTGTTVFNDAAQFVSDIGPLLLLAALGAVTVWIARRRPPIEVAVAVCTLAVFVSSASFIPLYTIWLVPFAALAGWRRFLIALGAIQLFLLPFKYIPVELARDVGIVDRGPFDEWTVWAFYIPASVLLWLLLAWQLTLVTRGRAADPQRS